MASLIRYNRSKRSIMRSLFFNEHGRIRSGWRAAVFLVAFVFLSFVFIFGSITILSQMQFGETATGYLPLIVPFAISAIIAVLLGWLLGKAFEGLPFRAIGIAFTTGWIKHLATGCLVGAVALGSAILIAVMSGGMSLTLNRESGSSAILTSLLTTLLIFAVGAASEETLFRGYLLQTFARAKVVLMAIWHWYNIASVCDRPQWQPGHKRPFLAKYSAGWRVVCGGLSENPRSVVSARHTPDVELATGACFWNKCQRDRGIQPRSGASRD